MNPTQYESLRNELTQLLQRAVSLESVSAETQKTLSGICRKALENQFEIVLAGEFQGGKSTAFNALCDGRNLSPTGSGIKTSGCIVSGQNISGSDESEKALVTWRNSEDLIAGFSDLLLPVMQSLDSKRFRQITALDLAKVLHLDRPRDRGLIKAAVDQEWNIWEHNKAAYDPEQKGRLDMLRFASLVEHYYADAGLNQFQQKHEFSLDDIGQMIIFPKDWEERWLYKNPAAFSIEEILFAFIHHVQLKLHSENLSRLGCVLVDCPGLFASRWDTQTARQAMFHADAILYLFDGSRTLKLSDFKALQFIRQNGMEDKLFYGCNMRGHRFEDSKRILQSTITLLKNNGFKVKREECILFHALLALRAIQAQGLIHGKLDPLTEKQIADAPEKVKKQLHKIIFQQLSILDIEDEDYIGLYPDSLEFARKISGLDHLMNRVEQTVIQKKAKSILIDNGSNRAANCLLEVEGSLHIREQTAFKKEKEFRKYVQEIEIDLQKFKLDSHYYIHTLEDDGPDYMLANDIWEQLQHHQEELCEKVSQRIYNEVINHLSFSLFVKKKFQDKIISIIKEEIDDCFIEVIHYWVTALKEGKNAIYNAQIVRRIKSVSKELKTLWEKSGLPEKNLLEGISIPEFSGDLELDHAAIFQELERNQVFENVRYNALLTAGGLTGLMTATSGMLVAVFVLITRFFWVRMITVVGFVVNIILMFLTRGMIEKKLKDEIYEKLSPAFSMLFYEIREDIKKEFQKFSSGIRELYIQAFFAAVDKPKKIFEERRMQAESDFRKSREHREAIAKKAKHIRQEQIQPLRIELQQFVLKVKDLL